MKTGGWRELDTQAHEAAGRHYNRTGWEPTSLDMPFARILDQGALTQGLATESDGEMGDVGDYEVRQRVLGVKWLFKFLQAKGLHPAAMLKQLAAVGRALHQAPFHELTMHEVAMLFSETPAAHSWRCKALSGEIKLAGMKGTRLPGQKSEAASESYKICRKGNTNRRGGKKAGRAKNNHHHHLNKK